jgi:quercetin dioxygenase-like cupin family protein
MILKAQDLSGAVSLLVALLICSACVSGPHIYLQQGNDYQEINLDKILANNPLLPGENLKVVNLGRSVSASQHVVQIRDREILHVHKIHDMTVTMMRGQGYLALDQSRINLKPGDVVHIPRNVVHQYVNTHSELSVALAVFSPPFDGKDNYPVGQP